MTKNKSATFTFAAIALCVAACVPSTASPSPVPTFTPFTPSTPSPVASQPIPSPAPTDPLLWKTPPPPQPTLSAAVQEEFYDLLRTNGGCELPCFLGIHPGETPLAEARSDLQRFAADGQPLIIPETIDGVQVFREQIWTNQDPELALNLALEVVDDRVDRILVEADVSDLYLTGSNPAIPNLSLRNILLAYGPPDTVYLNPPRVDISYRAYALYLFYERLKLMVELSGSATTNGEPGYNLCPEIGEGDIVAFKLALANSSDPVDIRKYSPIDFAGDPYHFPIEQVPGISVQDFYDLVTAERSTCFQVDYSGD